MFYNPSQRLHRNQNPKRREKRRGDRKREERRREERRRKERSLSPCASTGFSGVPCRDYYLGLFLSSPFTPKRKQVWLILPMIFPTSTADSLHSSCNQNNPGPPEHSKDRHSSWLADPSKVLYPKLSPLCPSFSSKMEKILE